MTNEDIIMIKNLQDGNIYTDEDIASLIDVNIEYVKNIDKYSYDKKNMVGDGSGVIYIMDIKYDTIVDGEGFRNTVYCAKCNLFCKECHNQQSWDIKNGKPITINKLSELLLENGNDISFSGGECTLQAKAFTKLAKIIKENNRNIWIYSGRNFENLIQDKYCLKLLKLCDVLVDGKFIEEEKDLTLAFKGSRNQRVIDMQKTLKQGKVVLYE